MYCGPDGTTVVTCIADAIWLKWWCKSPPSVSWVSELNISFCEYYFSLLWMKKGKIDMVKGKKWLTSTPNTKLILGCSFGLLQHKWESSLQTSLVIPKEQVPVTHDRIRRVQMHKAHAIFAIISTPVSCSVQRYPIDKAGQRGKVEDSRKFQYCSKCYVPRFFLVRGI